MTNLLSPNRDLDLLHPVVRDKVNAILVALKKEKIPFEVFEAYRTPHRQASLFAKGRPNNGPKVTWAEPWQSIHQYGLAVDFVLKINGNWSWDDQGAEAQHWVRMHEIAKENGMTPLFNSKGQLIEKPHVQMIGLSSSSLRAGNYPDGGDASWAENLAAMIEGWTGPQAAPPLPDVGPAMPGIDDDLMAEMEAENLTSGATAASSQLSSSEADARFHKLHTFIKDAEGGFVNHPDDDGGATNFGITQETLAAWRKEPVTAQDVKNMTQAEADAILRENYYTRCRCAEMPERTAMAVYNTAVMSGPKRAIEYLQRAFNETGMTVDGDPLEVDGVLGRLSMAAAKGTNAELLSDIYVDLYETYLRDHHDFDSFGRGWMNRIARLRAFLNTMPSGAGKRPKKKMKIADRLDDVDKDDLLKLLLAGATGGKSAVASALLGKVLADKVSDDPKEVIAKDVLAAVVADKLSIPRPDPTAPKPLTPVNSALGERVGRALDGKKSVIGIVGLISAAVVPQLGLTAPGSPELTSLLDGDNQQIIFTLLTIFTGWGFLGKIDKAIRDVRTLM